MPNGNGYSGGEVLPSANAEPREQWTPRRRDPSYPNRGDKCAPGDVLFRRARIFLPGGAAPAGGVVIVAAEPQAGMIYSGAWVRWGCDYPWLIEEGIITISILSRERTPYPLAEANANPREPIWLPWCEELGNRLEVRASWTDATLTGGTQIPVWAEIALGTTDPPIYAEHENRVRRRTATLPPIVVLPGAAFASLSPGVIRPTAGKIWLQQAANTGGAQTGRVQFSFATTPGGGAGNVAGHIPSLNPFWPGLEIEERDMRDMFIGDPLAALVGPVTINVHREVW